MPKALYQFLADDHDRLEGLLDEATVQPGTINMESYAEFRKGLLRHIAMEERTVLPTMSRLQGGNAPALSERIRLDHSALVALLVPPPTSSIVATIRSILKVHDDLEEREGGLYQLVEQLAANDLDAMLVKLKATPDVPVVPHNERPSVLEATRRAVARAGYELK